MSAHDARDTNHDGKVSMMEKVKGALHLGHKDAAHTTSTHATTHTSHTTHAGGVAGHTGTAGYDSRDLNHDGHLSASERLAAGHTTTGGLHTAGTHHTDTHHAGTHLTDTHHAGTHLTDTHHAGTHHAGGHHDSEEARLRLHEEQLAISKREVGAGEVDIHKRVQEEHVSQTIPLRRDEVTVERRPLTGAAEPGARIAAHDETVRVPLYREEVVTEKRIVPTEEVIVRKKEVVGQQTVGATLRSEYVETSQTGSALHTGSMDTNHDGHISAAEKRKSGHLDSRDTNHDGHVSTGEKLKASRG